MANLKVLEDKLAFNTPLNEKDFLALAQKRGLYSMLISPLSATVMLFIIFCVNFFLFGIDYGAVIILGPALFIWHELVSYMHERRLLSKFGPRWELLYRQSIGETTYVVVKDGTKQIRVYSYSKTSDPKNIYQEESLLDNVFIHWLEKSDALYKALPDSL